MYSQGNFGGDLLWENQSGNNLLWDFYGGPNFLAVFSVQTGAKAFQIGTDGFVGFYSGFGNASDASLKSTLEDASTDDCLQMLQKVSARIYERTDLPGTGPRIGFIAQEVRDACPAAFGNLIGKAQHGNGTEEREILIFDYARLSAVLWQSWRSLLARVEALEARLAQ